MGQSQQKLEVNTKHTKEPNTLTDITQTRVRTKKREAPSLPRKKRKAPDPPSGIQHESSTEEVESEDLRCEPLKASDEEFIQELFSHPEVRDLEGPGYRRDYIKELRPEVNHNEVEVVSTSTPTKVCLLHTSVDYVSLQIRLSSWIALIIQEAYF